MQSSINVVVHYSAALEPFRDHDASPAETLVQLKARILAAFGLTEGQLPDGNTKTYDFFSGKEKVTNLDQPLSALANGHSLQLKLAEQIIFG